MSFFPAVAGGGLALVGQQTIAGAPAANFTFAGLNGDVDSLYELFWWMEARAATASKIFLQPNDLQTNQLTTWTQTTGVGTPPGSTGNLAFLAATSGMARPQGWGHMVIHPLTGTMRAFSSVAGEGDLGTDTTYGRWNAQGMWNESATNITSLVLATVTGANAVVAGWGIGSRAQLWKRPF